MTLAGVQGQLVQGEDLAPGLEGASGAAAQAKCTLLSWGASGTCRSSSWVVVPTAAAALPSRPGSFVFWNIRERDRGGPSVGLMNEQPLQNHLLEGGGGSSG